MDLSMNLILLVHGFSLGTSALATLNKDKPAVLVLWRKIPKHNPIILADY